jgi:deoxyribodipyrimidine photolyase
VRAQNAQHHSRETLLDITLVLLFTLVMGLWAAQRATERRLKALQADLRLMRQHLGLVSTDPSAAVRELARDPRRRIDAIRLYREQSGTELREAQAIVDALAAQRD